jgi:hypothetical protein
VGEKGVVLPLLRSVALGFRLRGNVLRVALSVSDMVRPTSQMALEGECLQISRKRIRSAGKARLTGTFGRGEG